MSQIQRLKVTETRTSVQGHVVPTCASVRCSVADHSRSEVVEKIVALRCGVQQYERGWGETVCVRRELSVG
jgi:hypothetical protein